MENISVVIPLYNDEKNFNQFFDYNYTLIKKVNINNEIVLVDDTRNDSYFNKIGAKYKDVILIKHNENKGFSISINDGVNKASNELVFLLNSDIKLTKEAIINSVIHFEDTNLFGVSFKSIHESGKVREGAKRLSWKTGLPFILHSGRHHPPRDQNGKINTFYPVGGHSVVRKSMFMKLNGMDYKTFHPFYWEDTDLGYNALKKGWKIYYEPSAVVIHPPENSSIKDNFRRKEIGKIKFRNRVFFALKNFNSPYRKIMLRIGLFIRFVERVLTFKGIVNSYNNTLGLINEYKKINKVGNEN